MRKLLLWIEDRRIIASFIRGLIYISLALIIAHFATAGTGVAGSLIAGAYMADFSTWLGFHLLQISGHGRAFALKAVPNLLTGIALYEILNPSGISTDGADIGIAFIPFMLISTIKISYYLLVWEGIVSSDDNDDE